MIIILSVLLLQVFVGSADAVSTFYCEDRYNTSNFINDTTLFVKVRSAGYPANLNDGGVDCRLGIFSYMKVLWIGFISGKASEIDLRDDFENTTYFDFDANKEIYAHKTWIYNNNLTLTLSTYSGATTWTAYDAVVFSVEDAFINKCPFAGNLVHLEDDLIIPFASTFDSMSNKFPLQHFSQNPRLDLYQCTFEFTVPQGKFLKLAWRYAFFITGANNMTLTRTTENGQNVTEILGKANITDGNDVGQYFSGTYFSLNYNGASDWSILGFFALASAVDSVPDSVFTQCDQVVVADSKVQLFSNFNLTNGYSKNQQMCASLSSLRSKEVSFYATEYDVEPCCDAVYVGEIRNSTQSTRLTAGSDTQSTRDIIYSFREIDELNFMWKSDGSLQEAGFEVAYAVHDCVCAPEEIKISCQNTTKITPLVNDSYYCSGMKCNFTIIVEENCEYKYIWTRFSLYLRSSADVLFFYQNGKLMPVSTYEHNTYLLTSKYPLQLTLEATNYSSNPQVDDNGQHGFFVTSEVMKAPVLNKHGLTSQTPSLTYILDDLESLSGVTVCAPPQTVLELLIGDLSGFQLFDSDDLYNLFTDLPPTDPSNNTQWLTSTSGCFTVFSPYKKLIPSGTIAFFRIQNVQSKNCLAGENVIFTNGTYSRTAPNDTYCEVVIVMNDFKTVVFQDMTTTATVDPVLVYPSLFPDRKLFEFNSSTAAFYQNQLLTSPATILKIPKGQSLNITLKINFWGYYSGISGVKTQGVIASPDYCGYSVYGYLNFGKITMYFYRLNHIMRVAFKVDYLIGGNATIGGNTTVDGPYTVAHVFAPGEDYSFETSNFTIVYQLPTSTSKSGFLFNFVASDISVDPTMSGVSTTTTSSASTTTTTSSTSTTTTTSSAPATCIPSMMKMFSLGILWLASVILTRL